MKTRVLCMCVYVCDDDDDDDDVAFIRNYMKVLCHVLFITLLSAAEETEMEEHMNRRPLRCTHECEQDSSTAKKYQYDGIERI